MHSWRTPRNHFDCYFIHEKFQIISKKFFLKIWTKKIDQQSFYSHSPTKMILIAILSKFWEFKSLITKKRETKIRIVDLRALCVSFKYISNFCRDNPGRSRLFPETVKMRPKTCFAHSSARWILKYKTDIELLCGRYKL